MLNKNGVRELAYVVRIDDITEIPGYDRVELAHVGGWTIVVGKGEFKVGDPAIYFEIDSKLPEVEPFTKMDFLAKKHYRIKTQKMCKSISQGLLMSAANFGWSIGVDNQDTFDDVFFIIDDNGDHHYNAGDSRFLTEKLGVTYATPEENYRKSSPADKYKRMISHYGKLFSRQPFRWLLRREWGKKLLYLIFGHYKRDTSKDWPVGRFPGVAKTDQERVENMTWILTDKTPFIMTQKCDGSSGTYILERLKNNKFEFYVCSRNVRMKTQEQECFYGDHNYYWEVANKYHIEEKMRRWLELHPEATFVCWQGEICAPGIQGNPHHLSSTHFYCFHWTDSINGRWDIRDAAKEWEQFDMEVVPIVGLITLPDNFEAFKTSADGYYDLSVVGDGQNHPREGFVYYKVTDPTFSFKNVSREYLLKH